MKTHDQVAELSAFVDRVADPARPSIVMGDSNIGKKAISEPAYQDLLQTLKLQPTVTNGAFPAPDDMLNNWPSNWQTDIDHADLAREATSQWVAGEGTDLAQTWLENDPQSMRVDYIFVRNPVDRNALTTANRRHVFLKAPGFPAWSSPWPGPADKSSRLSDHKPLLTTLILAPYYVPGAYHPTWEQAVEFRVTSYDTTGIKDCWTCGELDVFTRMRPRRQQGAWSGLPNVETPRCNNRWRAAYRNDGCMANWAWEDFRPANVTKHSTQVELWDEDDSSSNDVVGFADYDLNGFELDWASGFIARQNTSNQTQFFDWRRFHDSAPVQGCTRRGIANICVQWSLAERSPYP